jgi:hypothetical protein
MESKGAASQIPQESEDFNGLLCAKLALGENRQGIQRVCRRDVLGL